MDSSVVTSVSEGKIPPIRHGISAQRDGKPPPTLPPAQGGCQAECRAVMHAAACDVQARPSAVSV